MKLEGGVVQMPFDVDRLEYLVRQPKTCEVITELIEMNGGLVGNELKVFNLQSDDEAASCAFEGLYRAITTFDYAKQIKFSTYATVCVKNGILQLLRKRKQEYGLLVSLDAPIQTENGAVTLGDILCNDSFILDKYLQNESVETIMNNAYLIAGKNNNQTACRVLHVWIASEFKKTNHEIAKELGVSQPHVNRIINIFRHKLRIKLKEVL